MKTLNLIASTLVLSFLFYSCDKNEFTPVVEEITDDAIVYYRFDGNAKNINADEYHGTPIELAYVSNRNLLDGKSASFNGRGAQVILPSSFDFESRTISVWFLANEISDYNRIYNSDNPNLNYGSSNMDVYLDSQSGKKYLRLECGGGQGKDLIAEIEEGVWYHAVLTVSPISVKAYLNGQLYDETSGSTHRSVDGDPNAHVGSNRLGNGNFMNGSIDDLIIYDRVLNESEIQQLFQL